MTLPLGLFLLFLSHSIRTSTGTLTCADVEEKGSGAAFRAEELAGLTSLEQEDLKKCTVLLGKERLSPNQSLAIWSAFIEVYGNAENIPEHELQQMGWIKNGIPPSHFANLTLSDIDTVASFGRCKELSSAQMENLRDAISEQWLGKGLEDFTSYDLAALRQILCSYNSTLIHIIHPDAYKDAAPELATISNCSQDVVRELAALATDERAFGSPRGWTSVQVGSVGCILAGLQSIADIPAEAFEGLTANIVECLPSETFQEMTNLQVAHLSPFAANALSRRKLALGKDKNFALHEAITGGSQAKKSSTTSSLDKALSHEQFNPQRDGQPQNIRELNPKAAAVKRDAIALMSCFFWIVGI
ncbi:Hypothetical protein NTJ_10013 [Nesidiocoris tenuis]|uniref:Otoancorin n=1 Tax=Nesidiocoris tenuis TaxID=355587 RepID=A0ABN7B0U7_9HEMI|nr:Hypothetical protein NTJ_10013 [Nesidiocoris tenuis]